MLAQAFLYLFLMYVFYIVFNEHDVIIVMTQSYILIQLRTTHLADIAGFPFKCGNG